MVLPHQEDEHEERFERAIAIEELEEMAEEECPWATHAAQMDGREHGPGMAASPLPLRSKAKENADDNQDNKTEACTVALFCLSGGTLNTHFGYGRATSSGYVARFDQTSPHLQGYGRRACEHPEISSPKLRACGPGWTRCLHGRPLNPSVVWAEGESGNKRHWVRGSWAGVACA